MRSGVFVVGLVLGSQGCGFQSSGVTPGRDATVVVDSSGHGSDAAVVPLDACMTFSSQFNTCTLALTGDLRITGNATYDTTSHMLTVGGSVVPVSHMVLPTTAGDVEVILAHAVVFAESSSFRAAGALPLAIVASGTISLERGSTVSVSEGGAGAEVCAPPAAGAPGTGTSHDGGGGGGGGGGYGAAGGAGGPGQKGMNGSTGGAFGSAIAPIPTGLRGGCAGAQGGAGRSPGGAGGPAGGGLYLASATRVELGDTAVLTAAGGGGRGGSKQTGEPANSGGGGGGSGGMIFLEAPHVIAAASSAIAANGGGGGEGASGNNAGGNGDTGPSTRDRAPGGSGPAGADGGNGGQGGSDIHFDGDTPMDNVNGGGGGGGGGVGYVRVLSLDRQLGLVSPAATTN